MIFSATLSLCNSATLLLCNFATLSLLLSNPTRVTASYLTNRLIMLKTLCALAAVVCLASCSTLFSGRSYYLTVTTNARNAKAEVNNEVKPLPAEFKVPRSRRDTLNLTLITEDSLQKYYRIVPRMRPSTYLGNAVWLLGYPIAFYVDTKNDRGYFYGNHLYLDKDSLQAEVPGIFEGFSKNSGSISGSYQDAQKDGSNITWSIPYGNFFYFNPKMNKPVSSAGFYGLSVGVEYFYQNNRYIKASGSAIINFPMFIPVPVDSDGVTESFYSIGGSLTDNFVLNRFTIGYGLTVAKNKWIYDNDGNDPDVPLIPGNTKRMELASLSAGLQVNGYFRMGRQFHIGVIYNPYLYDFAPTGRLNYQHTISIDLLWKLRILD